MFVFFFIFVRLPPSTEGSREKEMKLKGETELKYKIFFSVSPLFFLQVLCSHCHGPRDNLRIMRQWHPTQNETNINSTFVLCFFLLLARISSCRMQLGREKKLVSFFKANIFLIFKHLWLKVYITKALSTLLQFKHSRAQWSWMRLQQRQQSKLRTMQGKRKRARTENAKKPSAIILCVLWIGCVSVVVLLLPFASIEKSDMQANTFGFKRLKWEKRLKGCRIHTKS